MARLNNVYTTGANGTTLTEFEIRRIERKTNLKLPEEYRNFLLWNGNGCVGPHYGIFSIEKSIEWTIGFSKLPETYLSTTFPHKEKWNLWEDDPNKDNAFIFHKKETNALYMKEFRSNYVGDFVEKNVWNNFENTSSYYHDRNHVRGAITICDEGCGRNVLLVLSGSERGNVWLDGRLYDDGIYPFKGVLDGDDKRYTFYQWYNLWFDNIIQSRKS